MKKLSIVLLLLLCWAPLRSQWSGSADLQEAWVEEVRLNRRIFVLGARWKF